MEDCWQQLPLSCWVQLLSGCCRAQQSLAQGFPPSPCGDQVSLTRSCAAFLIVLKAVFLIIEESSSSTDRACKPGYETSWLMSSGLSSVQNLLPGSLARLLYHVQPFCICTAMRLAAGGLLCCGMSWRALWGCQQTPHHKLAIGPVSAKSPVPAVQSQPIALPQQSRASQLPCPDSPVPAGRSQPIALPQQCHPSSPVPAECSATTIGLTQQYCLRQRSSPSHSSSPSHQSCPS